MDVPFSRSGAMSRAHYALVRKIESATPQAADQILLAEVQSIRQQLARSTLTLKQCKENLILLLYCSMTMNPGVHVDLEFALPHAINLAVAGQTIQDKRTGYLFCAETMPPEHELQLMLVNSIRKDLDSPAVPRICLALDTLIQSPLKDVIPAVQTRLHDLLSHNSPHVRRRTLLAFDKLSKYEPEILRDIATKARKRLIDPEPAVVVAALDLCETLLKAELLPKDKYHEVVSGLLDATWSRRPDPSHGQLLIRLIQSTAQTNQSVHDLRRLFEIIHYYAQKGSWAHPIVYQCFAALSACPEELLVEAQADLGTPFVHEIRHLLSSTEPNDLCVFIRCLSSMPPRVWAGTSPEIPAVLEGWEVERVMKLLDSEDRVIRKQTLRTLWNVDQTIVEGYYTRALQGELPIVAAHGFDELVLRLLELLDIMCGDDGEVYAHQLKVVLRSCEGDGPVNKRPVLQEAVEEVLIRMHSRGSSWRSGCIGVLFTSVIEEECEFGPTLMVILTALLCEYLELSPTSPVEILRGLAKKLPSYGASIQDACLNTMLRISIACDEVPSEVTEVVKVLHDHAGRHIKRRCDQFLRLSQSKDALKRIISTTHSSSLPDFVVALEHFEAEKQRTASRSPSILPSSPPLKPHTPEPLTSSSRASPTPSKLRYAAYEPPRPTHRLRRLSSGSSLRSDDGSVRSGGRGRSYEDSMTMTVTPGELTLAAQTSDLRSISSGSPRPNMSPLPVVQILDEEPSGTDLIALDSPFMSEPAPSIASTLSIADHDFETTWNSFEGSPSRGWCEASIDTVLRRLQSLQRRLLVTERDRPPFDGDLKIVICPSAAAASAKEGLAVIRLKESDDDSCLWWLRCEDEELRNIVKATLR
ncbi:ARM repeat-containing protein [Trametes elegans]|nr:ARM repeat-containing protein [Trametes elegans]